MKTCLVIAPGRNITQEIADRTRALATNVELTFHPQCFLSDGHFAGDDETRATAFVDGANDPAYDALWVARGGYGACRILPALDRLSDIARQKTYLGYSDAGYLLAALYMTKIGQPVHAPMPVDLTREGGMLAVQRTLDWLAGAGDGCEPTMDGEHPVAAFNVTVLASLIGTRWLPDLSGHILMIEETGEYDYRFDRMLFQILEGLRPAKLAGLRLGRVSEVPVNTIEFGQDAEAIARHWCAVYAVPYLGRADIGHDSENKIVPFGVMRKR